MEVETETADVDTDTVMASNVESAEVVVVDNAVVLETDLEESVAVVPLEKTMEVPVSVDSTDCSAVIEVVEVVKAKAKPGRAKKTAAANKQEEVDVSTASEDEESGRGKRTRRKKKVNGKEKLADAEKEKVEEVEMLPPSPPVAPAKSRGRKRKVNDSSNMSNVSTASHESSIEHLSVSQNISSREEENNQSKGQETKAEKKKRIAEEKRVKAEEEKRKAADKEEEQKKKKRIAEQVQVAEAKTRSSRTKTIQKLLQELEPAAPAKELPSPSKAPSISSANLVEVAGGRNTRTRQRHQTPTTDEAAAGVEETAPPRSTRSKQIPLIQHASTSALHSVPTTASPRVRELAAAVSCSSLPRSNSPNRATDPASSSPVHARVQAFETAMRAQAGLKPVQQSNAATTSSDPQ